MNFIAFLNGRNVEEYFAEKISECGEYDKIPIELTNCNCCKTHKKNFPTLGSELPNFNEVKVKNEKDCKCPCRHIARHICREWETIHQVEDIEDAESSEEDSEDSEEDSEGSLVEFIVPDKGLTKKEQKILDDLKKKFFR